MASKKPKEAATAPEKVLKLGIACDHENFVYFVDRRGNLTRMGRGGKGGMDVLVPNAIKREKGYMYYLDAEGDLVREVDTGRE